MKKLIITLLIFVFNVTVHAQEFEFFSDLNFGVPTALTLRDFHDELKAQIEFENVKTTDNFYYNYGFTVGMRFNGNASVFFSNRVSGAKSSIADYSGFVRISNELNGYTFGLRYEVVRKNFNKGNLFLGVKTLVTSSSLLLKTESNISNEIQEDTINFKSIDYGAGVGINYEYPLKFVTLRAYMDLDFYYGGKLKFKVDNLEDAYLLNNRG